VYRVAYGAKALRSLARMDRVQARLIRDRIDRLTADPYGTPLDVKRRAGWAGFRLCVGDWRVIYELDDGIRVLAVLDVRHRREAYR
jgi:mRNA interferase RelE/StbE